MIKGARLVFTADSAFGMQECLMLFEFELETFADVGSTIRDLEAKKLPNPYRCRKGLAALRTFRPGPKSDQTQAFGGKLRQCLQHRRALFFFMA